MQRAIAGRILACGTAVTNLGHNHPTVVEAAHAQLDKFMHSGCVFRYSGIVDLAESLAEITPPGIDKFGFANSGAEAVEAAIKLAKYTTKRQGVVAFRGGFHGRTMGSVAYTTSSAKYRDGYHPLLGSVFITPFPHAYRWGLSEEAATTRALDELRLMLKHDVRPSNLAAFLVEPVQGEGGYYPAPPEFLRELRAIADEHGIALVFDEVQTGVWAHSQMVRIRPLRRRPGHHRHGQGDRQRLAIVRIRCKRINNRRMAVRCARHDLRRQSGCVRSSRSGHRHNGRVVRPCTRHVGPGL